MTPSVWERLPAPIKIRWRGSLRDRVGERQWDMGATRNEDGEWVPDPDARDEWAPAAYAALSRQKTNVVIKTVEEAEAVYATLGYYASGDGPGGITWMNAAMAKSARRVRREIEDGLKGMDGVEVDIVRTGPITRIEVTVQ